MTIRGRFAIAHLQFPSSFYSIIGTERNATFFEEGLCSKARRGPFRDVTEAELPATATVISKSAASKLGRVAPAAPSFWLPHQLFLEQFRQLFWNLFCGQNF
jgi:hypothetical protein